MILLALVALQELSRGEPIPWAESPMLGGCSQDAAVCLVRSPWEIVRLDLAGRGLDPALSRRTGLDRSLMGREFPLLGQWDSLSGAEILLGNETGDQVLQELSSGGSKENRNPATCARLAGGIGAWRGFLRLEQVDHYSDATRSERIALLGSPDLSLTSPWNRRAWFGENLPPYSLAGAGAGWRKGEDLTSVSFLDGWIWQHLPLSDRLVGWEIQQADLEVRLGEIRWEQMARSLDRMGPLGEQRTVAGLVGWQARKDQLETGLSWRLEQSWGPSGSTNLVEYTPWIRHELDFGGVFWSGTHEAGPDGHLLKDSVWTKGLAGLCPWRLGAKAQWTDHPDNFRPEVESSLLGRRVIRSSRQQGDYVLEANLDVPAGPIRVGLGCSPWLVAAPRSFKLDSATDQGRFGSMQALEGILMGWTQEASLTRNGSGWESQAGLRYSIQGGKPESRMDFSPPRWQAHLRGQAEHPLGLSAGMRLAWQSRAVVRNLMAFDWTHPPRWSWDLWLGQKLGRSGFVGKAALLDLTASDQADFPGGGQRRPRLLVSLDWHP